MMPEIEIYLNTDTPWPTERTADHYRQLLEKALPAIMAAPPGPEHILSHLQLIEISIVDDDAIARIHGEYLNDPTATDVITFPHGDGLGEIIVSADTAAAYASKHGLETSRELFRYIVHGLVHLHGYLDSTPQLRAELFAVQEPIVETFYQDETTSSSR